MDSPQPLFSRLRRALAARGSPHQVALGFTLGFAISFVPVPFLPLLAALGLTTLARGNVVAAYGGSLVMNPFTGPVIFFGELWLGALVMEQPIPAWEAVRGYDAWQWWELAESLARPFGLGAALFVAVGAVLAYPAAFASAKWLRARSARALAPDQTGRAPSAGTDESRCSPPAL